MTHKRHSNQSSISVIVPLYNAREWIGEALDSIFAQSRQPAELIVVDDVSTDGSADRVRRLLGTLSTRTVIVQPENAGAGSARNAGISIATGDWIAFLDADDSWLPDHLEVCERACAEGFQLIATATTTQDRSLGVPSPSEGAVRSVSSLELLRHNPINQSSAFVNANALREAGAYQDGLRFGEDYDLWARMSERGVQLGVSTAATLVRRGHANQTSRRNPGSMLHSAWETRKRLYSHLQGEGVSAQALRGELMAAFLDDLAVAWHVRSRELGRWLLQTADEYAVIDRNELKSWDRRFGWQWGAWAVAAAIVDTTRSR